METVFKGEKEWFSAAELAGKDGMPLNPQGVNKLARRKNWKTRRKKGVQGRAVEYHYSSLPTNTLIALELASVVPTRGLWEQLDEEYQYQQEQQRKQEEAEAVAEYFAQEQNALEEQLAAFLEHIKEQHRGFGFDLENLDKHERSLIDNFRKLPLEGREAVRLLVENLIDCFSKRKHSKEIAEEMI